MDICWRVPQDNQRIMIFEKLGYAVQQYEIERNKKQRFADSALDQQLNEMHSDIIKSIYKQIKKVKKLYRKKLPVYDAQVVSANKD